MRALALLAFALVAGVAAPALAAQVDLREDIASQGDKVTLGDLFYDAGAAADVVVARTQPGQTLVLDAARVQVLAHQQGLDWRNPTGLRRLIVDVGSAAPAPRAASERATTDRTEAPASRRAVQALTYLHSLNAGDIVRAEDLTWSKGVDPAYDAPRDAELMIGMAARRPLREGASVSLRDVSAPQVIKRDDIVAVQFNLGGISLTLEAKAMSDAAAGQLVTVVNPTSKKVIQAMAVGPGQAVVGPEADDLKNSARTSLSRLAQR